jgi:hypothetical protein
MSKFCAHSVVNLTKPGPSITAVRRAQRWSGPVTERDLISDSAGSGIADYESWLM